MTGAPKIRAMQLAEETETFRRGIYSGALGYFTNTGDFDFAVMIRSFTWNKDNGYLSFSTGSAITHKANAEAEYQECLLKAEALLQSLKP
jgi:para-aminobenzoate synthetase component 1